MKIAIRLLAFGILFLGTLVSAQSYSFEVSTPYYSAVPKNAVRLTLLEITVNAKENIFLSELWLQANGMVSSKDFGSVWAETDDYQKSMKARFLTDNRARIKFRNSIFIPAGTSKNISILVNLEADTGGRSFSITLEKLLFGDVVSGLTKLSPSILRRTLSIPKVITPQTTQTQKLTSFDTTEVSFEPSGSESTIRMGRYEEIGKFRLVNGSKNLQLRSIRFRNYGDSNLAESFDNFSIQQNGQEILTRASVDGDYLTIWFDNYFLRGGDSAMVSVRARLIYAQRNDTVQLGIQREEDFSASVVGTEFGARLTGFSDAKLKEHTLSPGGLTSSVQSIYSRYRASRANYSPTYRAADVYLAGSRDVLFLSRIFTQKNDFSVDGAFFPINNGSFVSDKNSNGIDNEISDLEATFDSFQLFVDGAEIDSTNNFTSRGGRLGLEFDTNFDIFSQTHIQIYGRITNEAVSGDKLKFDRTNIEFYSAEPRY